LLIRAKAMQFHRGSLWVMSDFDFQKHLYLGTRGTRAIALAHEDRLRHLYCVGQTGTGKSTFLLNLIAQDLALGRGCALLDPHGDLAVAAIGQVPRRRAGHLVYFNPADLARPIGFNLLARVPNDLRPLVADGVVSAFRHVWPDFWGPRLEHILANAVRTLMDVPDATLLCLPRLLQDDGYRSKLLRHLHDPVVRAFWTFEYDAYPARFREEAIAPVLNKIGQVLRTPAIRNIIAQPKSTIDLRFMMDEKRILIANLSKGAIGEGPSHLLGALLVTALARLPCHVTTLPSDRRSISMWTSFRISHRKASRSFYRRRANTGFRWCSRTSIWSNFPANFAMPCSAMSVHSPPFAAARRMLPFSPASSISRTRKA